MRISGSENVDRDVKNFSPGVFTVSFLVFQAVMLVAAAALFLILLFSASQAKIGT